MAMISGFGGGHVNANFFNKRNSIISENYGESSCFNMSTRKKPKKMSEMQLMKERIRQFSIWFFENEDHKEAEHIRRRIERKKKRKEFASSHGCRPLLWLYGLDAILWIIGSVFILCSSIKAFGWHTRFFKSKQLYRLLGSGILFLAVLVLFFVTALKHHFQRKSEKPQRNFYIVQKKRKNSKLDIDIKDPDNDSGNEEDIEMTCMGIQETELKPSNGKSKTIGTKISKLEEIPFERKMTKLRSEDGLLNKGINRTAERRAWAKTKWMRAESESGDSVESDDVLDLAFIRDRSTDSANFIKQENEFGETESTSPSKFAKTSESKIKRFKKPATGGCFTAQSSIRSQTSEMSVASTTSESAPLFRK